MRPGDPPSMPPTWSRFGDAPFSTSKLGGEGGRKRDMKLADYIVVCNQNNQYQLKIIVVHIMAYTRLMIASTHCHIRYFQEASDHDDMATTRGIRGFIML